MEKCGLLLFLQLRPLIPLFLISFDIKRTNVNTSASSTANVYTGVWVYYRYLDTDGTTVKTTGRGWYLRSTDAMNVVASAFG